MKDRTLTTNEAIGLAITPILSKANKLYSFHKRKNHYGTLEESFKLITDVISSINDDISECIHSFEITYEESHSAILVEFNNNNKFQVLIEIINSFIIISN